MTQCTAKSKRSQERCQKSAVLHKNTCHMHGGKSTGPKTMKGKERSRQAVFRHGNFTKDALIFHKEVMNLIKRSKERLSL